MFFFLFEFPPDMDSPGSRIAWARERRGMTQEDLAGAVGVHAMTVSKWERGEQTLRGKNLTGVAEALGTTPRAITVGADQEARRAHEAAGTKGGQALAWPEPDPSDPDDVKQYLAFFGAEADAFRRMAKRLPLSDIAKGCLDDAREEDMPDDHFTILYDRLSHLL